MVDIAKTEKIEREYFIPHDELLKLLGLKGQRIVVIADQWPNMYVKERRVRLVTEEDVIQKLERKP